MAETPSTPSKATGWTDAEKIALLVTLLEAKGGPDWKGIVLPPGRTQKACLHVWAKLKGEAGKVGWYDGGEKGTGKGSPKGKANGEAAAQGVTPRKRGAAATNDDGEGGDGSAKEGKKGKKGPAKVVKEEEVA